MLLSEDAGDHTTAAITFHSQNLLLRFAKMKLPRCFKKQIVCCRHIPNFLFFFRTLPEPSMWKDKNVTSALKIGVTKSVVWAVFQYGVEGWTLKKSGRNRFESFEMWCWRKMLGISWKEHRTNISILEEIGLERELMGEVAPMKLQYFGHVTRGSAGN